MAFSTKVYLLDVPLENDYKHTLYFANANAQFNYFYGKVVKSYTNFSYHRKDNYFRIPDIYDNLLNVNYVMYQNADYNNKWFYAFITDIKFINEENSYVYIETDCIQTWLFDYTVNMSFVEREHVNNDTIGLHTFPEQLETGDYICETLVKYKPLSHQRSYVIGATIDLSNTEALNDSSGDIPFPDEFGGLYNGIYSGVKYFAYSSASEATLPILRASQKGQADGIVCMFTAPRYFLNVNDDGINLSETTSAFSKIWSESNYGDYTQDPITKPTTINSYTPKNNKLFTYPYCYLLMSNNAGAGAVYKYELFKNPSNNNLCDFNINFAITPGCSIRLQPLYYNGISTNNEEGLNGAKFPICGWTTDVYINWLTQNSINIPVQIAQGAFSSISGAATGAASGAAAGSLIGPAGTIAGGVAGGVAGAASGVFSIASTLGEIYAHSLQPNQASGNLNSGDVTFSNSDLTFTAYKMSIKAEYARIIDGYFTMYGYKVNTLKVPNKAHRSRFWFTKTIDANISGAIPDRDMQIIKNCYNNGITFWRSDSGFRNYEAANNIV